MEIAVLGLGCFWGPEIKFSKLEGVIKTEVGYCGGGSKKIDNTVINNGAAYDRLTTTAKGSSLNATTIAIKAIKPIRHLNKCSFDLVVV